MRLRSFLICLGLLPLAACTRSCREDYDNASEFANAQLPPYSETGAQTMGCQLGSQTWTVLGAWEGNPCAECKIEWLPNTLQFGQTHSVPGATWTPTSLIGTMTGVRDNHIFYNTEIRIFFHPSDTLGGLRLLGEADALLRPASQPYEAMHVLDTHNGRRYVSRSQRPVRLFVRKFDRQQHIISGTFEGTVYGGASGNDSLAVTDGRFDTKY